MKSGAENRKKTIMAGVGVAVGLCALILIYNELFGAPPNPAAVQMAAASSSAAPAPTAAKPASAPQTASAGTGQAAAPGVAAKKMASTSSSLDPRLDEAAMLRTEGLVYAGTGRNIFSLVYVPPAPKMPLNVPSARPTGPVAPPPPPPPPPTCPPSCPPINLKFFGLATLTNGVRQAFLLSGEDVYLAAQGDIVARKYKIASISANSIQVEDLTNHNTQTLPLQSN
jgi:hypothetical protein